MPSSDEGRDFLQFLRALPVQVLEKLYTQSTTCIAVFRELPILARHILSRVALIIHPVPKSIVLSWVSAEYQSEQQEACDRLLQLRIWSEKQLPGGLIGYVVNPSFQQNFKMALLAVDNQSEAAAMLGPDEKAKDVAYLDNYAQERWECILHFMVGSKETTQTVSRDVANVLLNSGLMKGDDDNAPGVTETGFAFLLLDTPSQVWYFLQQYLSTVEAQGMSLGECVTLLLQLSFAARGKELPTAPLTKSQRQFLQHLRELGLVFQKKRTSDRFYPTKLAVNVVTGQGKSSATKQGGFIVVETNYRVYAYTDSSLQVSLISLFSDLLYRFPNMVVGNITRESVRQALQNGIKARQIINYLTMNAHPQMLQSLPVLPPTIIDQITLWEMERNRFSFQDGVLYNQFLSQNEFEILRDYARDIGVLMLENSRSRTIIVTRTGHDDVKKFWKRQRKS